MIDAMMEALEEDECIYAFISELRFCERTVEASDWRRARKRQLSEKVEEPPLDVHGCHVIPEIGQHPREVTVSDPKLDNCCAWRQIEVPEDVCNGQEVISYFSRITRSEWVARSNIGSVGHIVV